MGGFVGDIFYICDCFLTVEFMKISTFVSSCIIIFILK